MSTRQPRLLSRRSLIAGAGALGLAACGRSGPDAPLRFWAIGGEGAAVEELLLPFRKEQPALRLQIEKLPFSAAHEKLLTAFAGDSTPDIAQLGNTWIAELAALGALEPLQPWVDAIGLPSADYFEGVWRTNLIGGQLYGVPWYVDTRLLFYRRDLLARAGFASMPGDWPGVVKALQALQRHGTPHPLLLPLTEPEPLLALALQQDEPLLRDGDRYGNFRGAGFQRALRFYLDRFASGEAPYLTGNEIQNMWQEFGRGTFAAFISGPWNIGELDRRLPPAMKDSWGTAPMPRFANGAGADGPGASTAGGSSLVVFRRSQRKPDALKLLAYLSRPEVQLRFHALTGDLPPRRSTWQSPALAGDPRSTAFRQQLDNVKPTPAVPEWERIAQEMQLFATRAQRYGTPVPEICAALDERVDGFLTKRRWMLDRARNA